MVAQLMRTKGCILRGLPWWMAWANSSLPVPLSPVIKTGRSLAVALSASFFRPRMAAPCPMMLRKV